MFCFFFQLFIENIKKNTYVCTSILIPNENIIEIYMYYINMYFTFNFAPLISLV